MSEQVPTITDTTVRQLVDSEAVSSTADTTGRLIEASRVFSHWFYVYAATWSKASWRGRLLQYARTERPHACSVGHARAAW